MAELLGRDLDELRRGGLPDLLWEDGGYVPFAEKNIGVPEENLDAMQQAIDDWQAANL